MNYIELINHFWREHHIRSFNAAETFLYFCLLNECNLRNWQNPFECSNKTISAATGLSEKTLIDVRNRLKQKQMIDFIPGKRKERSPVYTILNCNKVSKNTNRTDSKSQIKDVDKKSNINIKTKTENKERGSFLSEEKILSTTKVKTILLDECKNQLLNDIHYHQIIAENYHWSNIETVKEWISRFFIKLRNEGVVQKEINDAKSHFARWLAIQIKENKQTNNHATRTSNTTTLKDYTAT